jgi:hypothetical protein
MKSFKVGLLAGQEQKIQTVGNYFRILSGVADVRVRIESLNIDTLFKVGVGVRLDAQFTEIAIYSDVEQVVELIAASGYVDDSRLTGDVDINGLLSVVNSGGKSFSAPVAVTLLPEVAAAVLPADLTRLKAVIQPKIDIFIGGDNTVDDSNGIKLAAGALLNVDNTAELWAYSVAGGGVPVLVEYL